MHGVPCNSRTVRSSTIDHLPLIVAVSSLDSAVVQLRRNTPPHAPDFIHRRYCQHSFELFLRHARDVAASIAPKVGALIAVAPRATLP